MFGKLFVKKHSAFEEVLVELTEDQLIVRSHNTRAPSSGGTSVVFKEVCCGSYHSYIVSKAVL